MVPPAARRHAPVRREPAEEVPGHLPVRLRDATTGAALWERAARACSRSGSTQGVRIFRVDNPHTKPFAFWEWADRARSSASIPDVIFLAEAFTRPKVMHRLAKLGFTQSYTYFTWRNTKHELTEYFTELTQARAREYFRPELSGRTRRTSCTEYLQYGGRPAFMARLVLAATLGANYGIYGPAFELLRARAARAGQRGIPRLGEVRDPALGPRRAGQPARPSSRA